MGNWKEREIDYVLACCQKMVEMEKKVNALVSALSEAEAEVKQEPTKPAAGPVEEGPAQPGMPKLGKKTPKGGQWQEARE